MKKQKIIVFFLALLLICALPMTAFAAGDSDAKLAYVTDLYGLLTQQEAAALEQQAGALSQEYECSLYILVVPNYLDYARDTFEFCKQVFTDYNLGWGSDEDGVLLMLSMADRDYEFIFHGDRTEYAFTEYARDCIEDEMLPEFRNDRYYEGFRGYLNVCGEALAAAKEGHPLEYQKSFSVLMFLPGVIAAVITYAVLTAQMKSQGMKRDANQYMEGTVNLIDQQDLFINRTVTRTRKDTDSDSRGSSHGSSHSSDGFSGRSGKF